MNGLKKINNLKMKRLIPVIHLLNEDQVKENIEICLVNNINQIFLINHQSSYISLLKTAQHVKQKYPDLWVGLNMLDVHPSGVLEAIDEFYSVDTINGLWFDRTLTLDHINKNIQFKGEIFSGLNFKYQKQYSDDELIDVINILKQTSTVACTSGNGTGIEANIDKIKKIKELVGVDFPLALASGVSVDNIDTYLPYVDNFLVASSITDNKTEIINSNKLKKLYNKILDYE